MPKIQKGIEGEKRELKLFRVANDLDNITEASFLIAF